MTQVHINRYCAIEGTICQREITYAGPWSYFFAYPSGPRWSEFSEQLQAELQGRGWRGERWEDVASLGFVYQKICDGIHRNELLLAEVTDPNVNVLFEIGYALAVGRDALLLVNSRVKPWDRRVLRTLESVYYETREDIHAHVTRLMDSREDISPSPPDRAAVLDRMGIFDGTENPGTVHHLKPRGRSDISNAVDSALGRGMFTPTSSDAADPLYDEFYEQARAIHRSSLIVGTLVSSDNVDAESINANVALLAGFAVGLGKQVLLLQQTPARSFIDTGTMLVEVQTETEARGAVRRWLELHAGALVQNVQRATEHAQRSEQASKIRRLYLGSPDAAQDVNLMSYYVRTPEYYSALDGTHTLFLGRKGSGKTATFQALRSELRDEPNTLLVDIAPADFQFERLTGFLSSQFSAINRAFVYQLVWRYMLVTEIVKRVAADTTWLYELPASAAAAPLLQYHRTHESELDLDFAARLVTVLGRVADIPEGLGDAETRRRLEDSVKALADYRLSECIRDFFRTRRVVVSIDDLDKHWNPDSVPSVNLLLGLIAETDRLRQYFAGQIHFALFLREDIYDQLLAHDDDLSKRSIARYQWDAQQLIHLVAERLQVASNITGSDRDVWDSLFVSEIDGQSSADYIVNHAFPRPRDVIDFAQKAIEHARRAGHERVEEVDLRAAFPQSLEMAFHALDLEFRQAYPGLGDVLRSFTRHRARCQRSEFLETLDLIVAENSDAFERWHGRTEPLAGFLESVLYRVGFVGYQPLGIEEPYFSNGRSFPDVRRLTGETADVVIHPALTPYLEVRP